MYGLKKIALATAVVFLSGLFPVSQATAAPDRSIMEALLDGHKVVNVVDDFLAFWEQAKRQYPRRQRRLWKRMVEDRHRDYFERAVYRGADPEQRRLMLDLFLAVVPERIDAIREFNKEINSRLIETLIYFKSRFPEYRHRTDLYIGLSMFMFDGSVRAVQNEEGMPDTLCLGADVLADYSAKELRMAVTHELFHLYHFGHLFQEPSLPEIRKAHTRLMIEGMAVAAAEAVYLYEPNDQYLHFSRREYLSQQADLAFNSQKYLELILVDAPPEQYEQWFSSAPSREVPLRGGYMLGYEVTRRVLAAYTLEQMVRMTPAQLREHAEEQLAAMTTDGVLMMAASS
ncbi:MAG: DUF2268 domain-containing putative Zn-dependent protease [Blastocatellia bacterium]|nr:DUF2268 domain-containing putative Zn-dependent protease [Blastocatellia bacterium]